MIKSFTEFVNEVKLNRKVDSAKQIKYEDLFNLAEYKNLASFGFELPTEPEATFRSSGMITIYLPHDSILVMDAHLRQQLEDDINHTPDIHQVGHVLRVVMKNTGEMYFDGFIARRTIMIRGKKIKTLEDYAYNMKMILAEVLVMSQKSEQWKLTELKGDNPRDDVRVDNQIIGMMDDLW
jgi:hypothetical protein